MATRTITITIGEYAELLENKLRIDILRDYVEADSYVTKERVEQLIGKPKAETEPIPGTEDDDF